MNKIVHLFRQDDNIQHLYVFIFSSLNIHFHYSYLILLYTLILLTILTTNIFSSYNLIHGQKYFYNIIIQWFKK